MTVRNIIIICIILVMTVNSGAADDNENITREFKSYVDIELGFYRVIDITTSKPTQYEGRNLTINQGDIVTWINDGENKSVTIMSREDLWGANDSFLGIDDTFSYVFDSPGKYNIYIKEEPTVRQVILVNGTIGDDVYNNIEDVVQDDGNPNDNADIGDYDNNENNDTNDNVNNNIPTSKVGVTPINKVPDIIEDTMTSINNINNDTNDSVNYSNISNISNMNNISMNNSSIIKIYDKNRDLDIFKFIWIIIIILLVFTIRTVSVLVTYKLGKMLK